MSNSHDAIITRITETECIPVDKVAIAFSGGLDSVLCVKLLALFYKSNDIILINVDVGQGDDEIRIAAKHAKLLGYNIVQINAKDEFVYNWITKAIKANGSYGGYPLGTAMTRHLIGKIVALKAVEFGCQAIAEGSSGKSNDQFRLKNSFETFAPGLRTIQPIRELNLTRVEEVVLAKYYKLQFYEAMFGGDDKTLWCRSIASGAITNLEQIPEDIWIWYKPVQKAKDDPTIIKLEFNNGIPTKLNLEALPLDVLIDSLNKLGGENGIGFIDSWEQDIIDIKSREFYEAPAALIILKAHEILEQVCFPKDEIEFKGIIDRQWSKMVFNGDWFHPLRVDLDAFIETSQKVITGVVELSLYKGNIKLITCESKYSLYKPEIRSLQSVGFDQRICGPAAELKSLPYKILKMRNIEEL